MARPGDARLGMAWRGEAGQGLPAIFKAGSGRARRGVARSGLAWRCAARLGVVRQGMGVRRLDGMHRGSSHRQARAQQTQRHDQHRSTARDTKESAHMEMTVTLTGVGPMLMHNERLASPLDPIARQMKEITSKRKKTDDDIEELARLEFEGGLYWDEDLGPYLPSWNVKRSIQDGAKLNKLGKAVERALTPLVQSMPIRYQGPRDIDGLWRGGYYDVRSVKVGTSKVSRCRPRFENWSVEMPCDLATDVLNVAEFEQVLRNAGLMVGIGDFRQRFGRYEGKVA